jgi:general secretion pathway protein K
MHKLSKQRGSAIIIALFVMSLAAAAATVMLARARVDVQRTQLILNADQANLYAQGSIDWAIDQLKNNVLQKKPHQLTDRLPMKSKVDTINGFEVSSTIEDMQGLFNLNNVKDADYQKNLLRLLHSAAPKLNIAVVMHIAVATHDWVAVVNSEDLNNYYRKLSTPYSAPHAPMVSVSEWRLVKGVTPAIYILVSPYLTALPETTPLNVNTAPALVFSSLNPSFTTEALHSIDVKRVQTPFVTPEDFLNLDVVKNNPVTASQITVESSYFLVKTSVKVGHQETVLYTLLLRTMKNSKPDVTQLWQTKGTM